jgi:uncharacterized membrane protein YdjX (TVP38/TMEM64 family)
MSGAEHPTTNRSWLRWCLAVTVVLLIAGFFVFRLDRYLSWQFIRDHLHTLQETVDEHLLIAAAVLFAVYVLVTGLSLPVATVLSLLAGALFGRWIGTLIVVMAATTGATLAMLGSRFLVREWVRRRFGSRLAAIDEGVCREGAYYLLTLRLMPFVPFWLINLAVGLTAMSALNFAAVTLVGITPAAFIYVSAGTALGSIQSPSDILTPQVFGWLILLGILPLAFRWLARCRRCG